VTDRGTRSCTKVENLLARSDENLVDSGQSQLRPREFADILWPNSVVHMHQNQEVLLSSGKLPVVTFESAVRGRLTLPTLQRQAYS
jgi:hypothetical protein